MNLSVKHYIAGGIYLIIRVLAMYGIGWAAAAYNVIPEQYVHMFDAAMWAAIAGNVIGQMQRQPQWAAKPYVDKEE